MQINLQQAIRLTMATSLLRILESDDPAIPKASIELRLESLQASMGVTREQLIVMVNEFNAARQNFAPTAPAIKPKLTLIKGDLYE